MVRARPHCSHGSYRLLPMCILATTLGACGPRTVTVTGDFPELAMRPLPVRVGVYLDDALTGYVYPGDPTGRSGWVVDMGAAHEGLFRQLGRSMFGEAVIVSQARTPEDTCLDAVLQPSIETFQLLTPKQTGRDLYEVWIGYRMRLYDPHGELISDWTLLAYGRSPPILFGSSEKAVQETIIEAMRDVAAALASRFVRRPAEDAFVHAGASPSSPNGEIGLQSGGDATHAADTSSC